jgi:hypothetical protein
MKLQAGMETSITMMAITMAICIMTTIFLISVPVPTFAYYKPAIMIFRKPPPILGMLYSYVLSTSNRSEGQSISQQQQQSKVIEASGHFANNQIENDSVSWIQGGLWHVAVYNSSSSSSSSSPTTSSTTQAKAIFSGNFKMVISCSASNDLCIHRYQVHLTLH